MSEILQYIKHRHIKQVVKEQERTQYFKTLTKDWKKNLDRKKRPITKPVFWREMVHARLTSQTKVERVEDFMKSGSFLLDYEKVRSERDVEDLIAETVRRAKIRFPQKTAEHLACNLAWLEEGDGWKQARDKCNRLTKLPATTDEKERQETEREVANYVRRTFKGFGPKQSRNLLQMLRLTRYETPIDSRVMNWLNQYLPPHAQLTSRVLSNSKRYESILDDIQQLCREAKEYPRVFDAAVFSVMDRSDGRVMPRNC